MQQSRVPALTACTDGSMRLSLYILIMFLVLQAAPTREAYSCDTIKDIEQDTATALAQIHANQHPPVRRGYPITRMCSTPLTQDCKAARYLLCAHARGGVGNFGSKLVALASCFGRAMQHGAVAIQATGAMGVGNLVDQLAPFLPWSNCRSVRWGACTRADQQTHSLEDAKAVQTKRPENVVVADFLNYPEAPEDSVHGVRKMSYDSMPKQWRRRGKVWCVTSNVPHATALHVWYLILYCTCVCM